MRVTQNNHPGQPDKEYVGEFTPNGLPESNRNKRLFLRISHRISLNQIRTQPCATLWERVAPELNGRRTSQGGS
jgi:hypothetical protein